MKNHQPLQRVAALLSLCLAGAVFAWPEVYYSDIQVVSRAELIVVARLKEGSIVSVPNPRHQHIGYYRLELLISQVLKSTATSNSIVVADTGAMLPVIGRCATNQQGGVVSILDPKCPQDMVQFV